MIDNQVLDGGYLWKAEHGIRQETSLEPEKLCFLKKLKELKQI